MDSLLENFLSEKTERFVLPNGLTVVCKEDHSAEVIATQLWVKTGSIHEGELLGTGISHYLEHMLFKGTKKRSHENISSEIQSAGGSVNAYTTFDRTVYHINAPCEALEVCLDVLSDIGFNSVLDEGEVESERSVIQREIDMGLDDPDRQLSRGMFSTAFRTHPYRFPVIGERVLFDSITREELWNYYKGRYVPNNMTLVVVGSFNGAFLKEKIKEYFSSYERGRMTSALIEEEPIQLAERTLQITGDFQLVRGAIAFKVPGLYESDAPALDVLANILGSGASSLLWQTLREEKKLVHYIDASVWNPGKAGLFWISYHCDAGKQEEVVSEVFNVIEHAKELISQQLLDKARAQAIVGEVNLRKTMLGQANRLGISEVVIGDLQYARNYFEKLDDLRPEHLTQVLSKYLVRASMTHTCLLPEGVDQENTDSAKTLKALEDFEEFTFENGARLIFQQDASFPKVHLRYLGLGGALYEPENLRGATALIATLLTKDTSSSTALEVAQNIEQVGASLSEMTGNNSFGLTLESLAKDFPSVLEYFEQALLAPAFVQKTFETEKEAQIAQIREENDEIFDNGFRYLRKLFFGEHPYCDDALGRIESLEKMTSEDMQAIHQKLVCAQNAVFVVTGQFAKQDMIEQLRPMIEKLPQKEFKKQSQNFECPAKLGYHTYALDRKQAVVFQAYPGVGVGDPDYYVAEVLDEILSGMSSELFLEVRERRGLAYYVGSSRIVGVNTGMFYLYAGTNPDQAADVLECMEGELKRILGENITSQELERAQMRLKSGKKMALQSIGSRAVQAGLDGLYDLPINRWKEYGQIIDAVNLESLHAFAQERLIDANKVQLVVQKED